MTAIDLSIIIPAYQEGSRIGQSLTELAEYLDSHDYGTVEVVVVVAESKDDTVDQAMKKKALFKHFRVVNAGPRVGKGRDVRLGIFEAKGRYKLFMDADLATPLHHLDDVAAIMGHDGKVGIAVRSIVSTHKGLRKYLSEFGNILTQVLIVPGIKDTQCGFKVFEAEAADEIFSRQTILGWAFDMELLLIAKKLGYSIETFPANDWNDPKINGLVGESAMSAAVGMFGDMLKIRKNALLGRYRKKSFSYQSVVEE